MLSEQFIAARKRDLLKEKERLEREISQGKQFEEYGDSEDDSAQEVAAYEKNLSAKADFQRVLKDINAALEKIGKGTYGKCEMGPEDIEEERLRAFPAATVCVKHQRELDLRGAGRRWWQPWTWRK